MIRGRLAVPDPTRTDTCVRPGCEHPEGVHLLCGCDTGGCGCPDFAIAAPTCPHCGREFRTTFAFKIHQLVRTELCRAAERAKVEAWLKAAERWSQRCAAEAVN